MLLRAMRTKGLSLFVVWMLAASLLVGLSSLFAVPAAAQPCERSGGPTPGDWIITNAQTCENIVIVMDGDLVVQGGGSLTLRNGGLKFVEDTTHIYSIQVQTGGSLTLENSKVWTETNLINPYLRLAVSIAGTFAMDASTLAFPGTVDSTDATVILRNGSKINRTEAVVSTVFASAATQDDNDDAPGLTFTSSTVSFFASRVENLYENTTVGFTGDTRQNVRLMGSTTFTAADTFLAIDFCCKTGAVGTHNALALSGTARAFLYGVTTDATETQGVAQDQWVSAVTTASGTSAYLYRWANVRVADANGVPVDGADINADFAGPETGPANFTDNGGSAIPPFSIVTYLGRTNATWDDTDVSGSARMPLVSDWIDSSSQPGSRFVGTFTLTATSGVHTGSVSLTFAAYPAMDEATASSPVTIIFSTLTQPLPDLTPLPPTFMPAIPKEGQTVQISAAIANQGAGGAANVLVRVFDGVNPLVETTIPFIGAGSQQTVATSLVNATAGQHVIRISVDPNNAIIEGPAGSPQETNNLKGYQLSVTPLGPDLEMDVSFNPDPGFLNNPVSLIAGVTNIGDQNATNVVVNFYVQGSTPDAGSAPVGTALIPFIDIAGVGTASVNWTPTSLATFRVWAWADPNNEVPEPAPYSEANNLNFNDLTVAPAPDLVTFAQDLSLTDPFPRVGQPITLEAVVRNNGQAPTGGFQVQFFVDGNPVTPTRTNTVGLQPGEKWTVPTVGAPAFATCGTHTIGIHVDVLEQVTEGALYEMNNRVTTSVQVFPDLVYSWSSGSITSDQAFSRNLEITGPVTISGARVTVVQDQDPCGRYYVKVLSGGSLTLTNAELTSNWPLVVFVATDGSLTATGSTFTLDVQGKGILSSKGTLTARNSVIAGDVVAKGVSADLRGDTFRGSLLHIDASAMSRIWDSTFPGVTSIQLASDALGAAAIDFDIRNVTFNAALTNQLVFSGDQWVQFTSVTLTKAGDWWAGMLTQSAHVTRYWWLHIEAVDGTGTAIQDPSTSVDLQRFNPTTLAWDAVPPCATDECYFNSNTTWMVGVPSGVLLYRAAAEDRYGPLGQPPLVRATYRSDGWAFIEGQVRKPDQVVSALVTADTTITLVFSELTPDLSVASIRFDGDNGNTVDSQPIGRPLNIVATIANAGEIITRDVIVNCYSTDVDVNRDGYLDNPHSFYENAGLFIGQAGPTNVPALSSVPFVCNWTPLGTLEGSRTISVVVDPSTGSDPRAGGAVAELNEANNLATRTVVIFTWPDLHLASDPVISFDPPTPIVNNSVTLTIELLNEGTTTAIGAVIGLYRTDNTSLGPSTTTTLARGATTTVTLVWVPTSAGLQTLRIRVLAAGAVFPGDYRNWDFDLTDNFADKQFDVATQPELSVSMRDPPADAFRGAPFQLNLTVTNSGQTTAPNIVITVVDQAAPNDVLGAVYGVTVPSGSITVFLNTTEGLSLLGDHTLIVTVDANNTVNEPDETNNQVTAVITVIAPSGSVRIEQPAAGTTFKPGDAVFVRGKVLQTGAFEGTPIGGVLVTVTLLNPQGNPVPGATNSAMSATNDGSFNIEIEIPSGLADGTYTIHADAADPTVQDRDRQIVITTPLAWWQAPFLGLPVFIWLIVIIGAAAAIGGGTAYVKFVGLGKLVECGECGSFIAEDSTKCPKCGVEFEKDMAKCSNCQAWIPVDVKQCPECGVEFATGEVEMADYEAQMRRQYDEVKRKFREEASRELGRALSDKEFEDWWRTQPTFVTFEDWLREEEEMRRMGSKPCPVCNTLNSVTATVCHKCGTLLKEEARRPEAAGPRPVTPAAGPPAQPPTVPPTAEEGAEAAGMPTEAIPKKVVVKKPVMGAPVVQKKVIRRPLEEEKKEGEEEAGGEEEQI